MNIALVDTQVLCSGGAGKTAFTPSTLSGFETAMLASVAPFDHTNGCFAGDPSSLYQTPPSILTTENRGHL